MTHHEPELLAERQGRVGLLTLNRPRQLNALTIGKIRAMQIALDAWRHDPEVDAVVIRGAGHKAFCAGGDIRHLYNAVKGGDEAFPETLYRDEYALDRSIRLYPKPYVALLDGICMGGGCGVGVNAEGYRIVTERSLIAMPETDIGYFPDVGATHFLSRCPGAVGTYLALCGARMSGADALYAGLADYLVPHARLPALMAHLTDHGDARAACEAFAETPPPSELARLRPAVDRCFAAPDLNGVLAALEREPGEWAAETRAGLSLKAPFALRATHRAITEARHLNFDQCIALEFRMGLRMMLRPDFAEGVRARIIDKDNAPQWQPARLNAVDEAELAEVFAPLGARELQFS